MANVRLQIFENFQHLPNVNLGVLMGANSIHIQGIYVPGSISFNKVHQLMRISFTGTRIGTLGLSFGLYSLNGSTLSLANSASASTAIPAAMNSALWMSLATSATQDITPGNWYLAFMSSSSINAGAGTLRYYIGSQAGIAFINGMGGPFVRGAFSTSSNAMPASMATTDCIKEGANADVTLANQPHILIGA